MIEKEAIRPGSTAWLREGIVMWWPHIKPKRLAWLWSDVDLICRALHIDAPPARTLESFLRCWDAFPDQQQKQLHQRVVFGSA